MWIAELLDNRWSNQVISDISAFEKESKGDGILQFYVFLHENIGYTKEAIILAEQQLTKEKLALENFDYDISKFTNHARTYLHQIINAGSPVTNRHFILVFSALKECTEDEFKLIIMQLYEGWCKGTGEGVGISILQLLAKPDSEYIRLVQLDRWTTKNKPIELIGLQSKFDVLQIQFTALLTEHSKLKNKPPPTTDCPTGASKSEENEEQTYNGRSGTIVQTVGQDVIGIKLTKQISINGD